MDKYLGQEIKKLGFGFMRLPGMDDVTDIEQVKEMVDIFMAKGFTYFDTAYVYGGGKSEEAIKEAVVDRYPRESFQLATKLPVWNETKKEDMEKIFNISLERTGAGYFDFYLLHALNANSAKRCEELGAWEYIAQKKAEGKIKHIGFSFHDSAEVLDDILTKHPEAEFVQLQLNYIDWESENVQSRACYEVALKHNMPIIVMEPVKGGSLASLYPEADKVLKTINPELSTASWAVRYVASLKNIVTVLSGMSNLEQLNDNVSYMDNFESLSDEENAALVKAVDIINQIPTIPCTKCKYCVDGCPQKINIPDLFSTMNHYKKFDNAGNPTNMWDFNNATENAGKPSECISCGACEEHCPQKIEIINELKEIASIYEK